MDFKDVNRIIIPEGEVSLIARGEEILWKKPRLPVGYREALYIEGIGTEYIDTAFIPGSNTRVLIEADVPKKAAGATYVFGTHDWSAGKLFQIRITSSSKVYTSDYGSSTLATNVRPAGRMTFDKNKNVCTVGDVVVTNTEKTFTSNTTLTLLAGPTTADVLVISPGKIYSCKVWDNDVLIRDFVPCITLDDVAGLYDLVNSVFYGNAGTGEFLYELTA